MTWYVEINTSSQTDEQPEMDPLSKTSTFPESNGEKDNGYIRTEVHSALPSHPILK